MLFYSHSTFIMSVIKPTQLVRPISPPPSHNPLTFPIYHHPPPPPHHSLHITRTPQRKVLAQMPQPVISPLRSSQHPSHPVEEEKSKERVYQLLKKMAESQIRESKMVDRIKQLQAERDRLQQTKTRQHPRNNDLDSKLQRIEQMVATLSQREMERENQASRTNTWINELIGQMNEERKMWMEKNNNLMEQVNQLRDSHALALREKEMRITSLEKQITEQHEFIRWVEKQEQQQSQPQESDPAVLKRIGMLYNDFFSIKQ